jgi:hypothetical protein
MQRGLERQADRSAALLQLLQVDPAITPVLPVLKQLLL